MQPTKLVLLPHTDAHPPAAPSSVVTTVIADDPSVRSTKLSRAQFLHLAASTVHWLHVAQLRTFVGFRTPHCLSDWHWQLGAVVVPITSSTQMLWQSGPTPFRSILILPLATSAGQNNFLFCNTSRPTLGGNPAFYSMGPRSFSPEGGMQQGREADRSPPPTTPGNEWSHTSFMARTSKGAKQI